MDLILRRGAFLLIAVFLTATALAERVSVTSDGSQRNGASRAPAISADGRFVAFETVARLVPEDRNEATDVYVRDRKLHTTRLISDGLGGDQPTISANGRFVAYRSFEEYEDLTRIRVVDMEQGGPSISGAVQNANSYYQPADSPLLSANGRFLAFAFRPSPNFPFSGLRDHEITVVDIVTRTKFPVVTTNVDLPALPHLGRFAMDANAETFVFESNAPLTADDTNGTSDIYLVRRSAPGQFTRLSRPSLGIVDLGGAHDPVISLDGTRVFFIADNPLASADTDDRATIYSKPLIGGINTLAPISTKFPPLHLAGQATLSGKFLGYLAQREGGFAAPFVINLADGGEVALAPGADGAAEAPVLSGDDHVAAFSSAATNLGAADTNGSADVIAVVPTGAPPARTPPAVVLAAPRESANVGQGIAFSVSASATDPAGSIRSVAFDLGGVEVLQTAGSKLASSYSAPDRGIFPARARAFNDAWIEGVSASSTVTVVRSAASTDILGVEEFTRMDEEEGSVAFDATLRIQNRTGSLSSALRLVVTAASTPFAMDGGGDTKLVPSREEQVLTFQDIDALAPGESRSVSLSGITPPTEEIGNEKQGVGWTITARLRNAAGTQLDMAQILVTYPRLNEQTFAPNGGIPNSGLPNADGTFNPSALQSLSVQGRDEVAEGTLASYKAMAVFNTGSKLCSPTWSLQSGTGVASISPAGVLSSGNITSPTTVTVKADFEGRTATRAVKIQPVTPTVVIRAKDKTISEGDEGGTIRIVRTPVSNRSLTIRYEVSGKATPGKDYAALSGSTIIPAGAASVSVDVTPVQDTAAEGTETVIVKLLPSADYRRGAKRTAEVLLVDDDPAPAGQPDVVIRLGNKPPVGEMVFDQDEGTNSDAETSQVLKTHGVKNHPVRFTVSVFNPDTLTRNFTVFGGQEALGFTARYFAGDEDVTAAVVAGTFAISQVAAGTSSELTLEITPTKDAAIGTSLRTEIRVKSDTQLSDVVQAVVKRVK